MDTFIQLRSLSKRVTEENEIHVRAEDQFVQGLIGFTNPGSYCYINSVLQALSNCPPFVHILINSHIPRDHSTATSFSISAIFKEIWVSARQPRTLTSRPITQSLRHPTFNGLSQQDAQEFMRHILNRIHEEMREEVPDYFRRLQEDNRSIRSEISSDVTESYEDILHADRVISDEPQNDVSSIFSNLPTPAKIEALPFTRVVSPPDVEAGRVRSKSKKYSHDSNSQSSAGPPVLLPSDTLLVDPSNGTARLLDMPSKHSHPLTDTETRKLYFHRTPSNSASTGSAADSHLLPAALSTHSLPSESGSLQRRNRSVTPNASRREPFPAPHRPAYRSLVTDLFEGHLKSTVKCLTCKKVSITTERFQDLSLPIPNKKELSETKTKLQSESADRGTSVCNIFSYLKSLIASPETSLEDCLHVFFRKDELNGSNRYFCESCNKLRNSIKFSRIHRLPEILCIHFKRFRHDGYWASSKISRYIAFPLHSLDLAPYMVKGTRSPGLYNLVSAVCHIGGVGGGHYVTYTQNEVNRHWYLFDDDIVRRVTAEQVRSLQTYMLIYRLHSPELPEREHIPRSISPSTQEETFYISKHWLCLYDKCMYPGPIAQFDFVCAHGKVKPSKEPHVSRLVRSVTRETWEMLHERFGGGPPITDLSLCQTCQEDVVILNERRAAEKKAVNSIQDSCCRHAETKREYYGINPEWLREWQTFINSQDLSPLPPGPVDNRPILSPISRNDTHFRYNKTSKRVNIHIWEFFSATYGGGPTVIIPSTGYH